MGETTPIKKTDLNVNNLTPVRFFESPNTKIRDVHGIHQRLKEIIRILIQNQLKWEAAQTRGSSLCNSIESIKTKTFEPKDNVPEFYPPELQAFCDKLRIITSIFDDILKSTQESLRQLKNLAKLNQNNEIIFKTWQFKDFINFAQIVLENYEKEYQIKNIVTEKIAHSRNRAELVFHSNAWTYPAFVDENVKLLFKFLSLETKEK